MNRLTLERVARGHGMLTSEGLLHPKKKNYQRSRDQLLDDPSCLVQFIRACEYIGKLKKHQITAWHRENNAVASRLIPKLSWEFGIEFRLGPVIAALIHHRFVVESNGTCDPIIGLDQHFFKAEMEFVQKLLSKI